GMAPRSAGCFLFSVISPFQQTAPAEALPPFTTHSPKSTGSVFEVTVRWHVVGCPSTGPHFGAVAKSFPAAQSWPTVAFAKNGMLMGWMGPGMGLIQSPTVKLECGRNVFGFRRTKTAHV